MTDASYYRSLVASVIRGKPWIVAMDVLVPAAAMAQSLLELGASRVFALGASRGAGEVPDPAEVPQLALDNTGADMMLAIRSGQDLLANLPAHAREALDAFDPDREARVITALFSDGRPVGGRSVYGARPAAWQALEDKVIVDAFWDAAGIERAPAVIVAAEESSLRTAWRALDRGGGAVLAGDNREGFSGAAWGVRWVRTDAELVDAAAFFGAHCDTVRVMPFLDGIPCSIHGVVLPEHLLAIRPCEMVVFRKPASSSFHYASAATFWDPRPEDREAMRAVARRAGAELRRQVGYRGVFTVDGVMTADGFLPTELNPRFGAAINILSRGMPELPLYLLHLAIAEGEPFGWRGPDLEALVVASGDRVRKGGGALMVTVPVTENRAAGLVLGDAGWRWAQEGEPVDAEFKIGPSTSGGRVWVSLNEERTPIGPSAAPRVAEALAFLDRELGLDIGPLEPAPDLRP